MKKLVWISASLAICIALAGCSTVKEEKKDTTGDSVSSSISEEVTDSSSEEEEEVDFSAIDYPDSYDEFEWPDIGIAATLPTPKSTYGHVFLESNDEFMCSVGKVTKSDYQAYIKECYNAGYKNDYQKTEHSFTAFDDNDSELTLYFMDSSKRIEIRLYSIDSDSNSKNWDKDEDATSTDSTDNTISDASDEELVDGMRPEFKEAVDSYVEFMDAYVEFVEKYQAEDSPDAEMLKDYADYVSKLSEVNDKFDALDDGNMNDAESTYYINAQLDISKKLLELSTNN